MLNRSLKIGIVCPYSWDTPGGVQNHIRDLAEYLIQAGHQVSVLAPVMDEEKLPYYVVSAGKPISIPYNGAVASTKAQLQTNLAKMKYKLNHRSWRLNE